MSARVVAANRHRLRDPGGGQFRDGRREVVDPDPVLQFIEGFFATADQRIAAIATDTHAAILQPHAGRAKPLDVLEIPPRCPYLSNMSDSRLTRPCQPTTATRPPAGPNWIHEIKHDGYRLLAHRAGVKVRCVTRNGINWADRFPSVVAAVAELKCLSCTIDGEVVVADHAGVPTFDLLRSGNRVKAHAFLYAFDLIEIDGDDLRRTPIEERKARLARLLKRAKPGIQFADHIQEDGAVVFEHVCMRGLEGIVSKRLGSHYRSGPSRDWIKTKNPKSPAVIREATEDWNGRRPYKRKKPVPF